MAASRTNRANLNQAVPFLGVTDMERSLRFYLDGLGFAHEEQVGAGGQHPLVLAHSRRRVASCCRSSSKTVTVSTA